MEWAAISESEEGEAAHLREDEQDHGTARRGPKRQSTPSDATCAIRSAGSKRARGRVVGQATHAKLKVRPRPAQKLGIFACVCCAGECRVWKTSVWRGCCMPGFGEKDRVSGDGSGTGWRREDAPPGSGRARGNERRRAATRQRAGQRSSTQTQQDTEREQSKQRAEDEARGEGGLDRRACPIRPSSPPLPCSRKLPCSGSWTTRRSSQDGQRRADRGDPSSHPRLHVKAQAADNDGKKHPQAELH